MSIFHIHVLRNVTVKAVKFWWGVQLSHRITYSAAYAPVKQTAPFLLKKKAG